MLVVSSDVYTRSKIATVVCAVITSNMRLADAPGNVPVGVGDGGIDRPVQRHAANVDRYAAVQL